MTSDQSGASIVTTDQSQAGTHTPEPTFENEPRYSQQPPDTPKRSPEKRAEPNPLLKLAVILASHWLMFLIFSSHWSRCLAAPVAARSRSRMRARGR